MKLTLEQIIRATNGQVIRQQAAEFDSFGIDSRTMKPGGLFFAMKGENTDGHLFVNDALKEGASGAVISHPIQTGAATLIQVNDTMTALHALSASVRSDIPSKFIGITGSSGKTSTKEFTAALLSEKFSVFKSEGNLNSLTGLPLSILSMEPADCAVFEVAMNHPGEIAGLSRVLKPGIGVLLNVNPVHLGQFQSIEDIAKEKCSLVEGMSPESVLVFNGDDPRLVKRIGTRANSLSYGLAAGSDVRITDIRLRGVRGAGAVLRWNQGEIYFETQLCGMGNLYNVAAAATVSIALGLNEAQIRAGIQKLRSYRQRGVLTKVNGYSIYDDSYNSNPRAVEMALDLLGRSEGFGRKIAVLGDMLELGTEELFFHAEAGRQAAAAGVDVLIAVGTLSKATAEEAEHQGVPEVYAIENSEEAAKKAAELVRPEDVVLVKGSRGIKMERVVEELSRSSER